MMTRPRILTGLLLSVLMLANLGNAQTKTVTISANNGAPLFDAVMQIEKLSGARIFYESTRDEFTGAYEDVTSANAHPEYEKIHGIPPKRILGPKSIPLSSAISVDAATGYLLTPASVEEALKAVIAAYNIGSGPGAYALDTFSGGFYVKPTHMRDERGQRVALQSVLSAVLSLPLETRLSSKTIEQIADQMATKSGVRVRVDVATDIVPPIPISTSANEESAVAVLGRLLGSVERSTGNRDITKLPIKTLRLIYHPRVVGFMPGSYRLSAARVYKPGIPEPSLLPPPRTLPPPTAPPGSPLPTRRRLQQ